MQLALLDDESVELPGPDAWLEAWAMDGSGVQNALAQLPALAPPPKDLVAPVGEPASPAPQRVQQSAQPFRLKLSPIKGGVDRFGHSALVGFSGMLALGVGIDKEGRVFAVKQGRHAVM